MNDHTKSTDHRTPTLSVAEHRLVEKLAEGVTLREVAGALGIRYETARSQCKNAMRKYGVRTQVALVLRWLKDRTG